MKKCHTLKHARTHTHTHSQASTKAKSIEDCAASKQTFMHDCTSALSRKRTIKKEIKKYTHTYTHLHTVSPTVLVQGCIQSRCDC